MKHYGMLTIALLICLLISPPMNARAQTDLPVVHAVLFYSPTCGHCEYVINETLIPLMEKYGEQLQIIAMDVSQPASQELFIAALQEFGVEQGGVPFLVFDDTYLIGSGDIPEKFPGLVESYLAQGGLDWPDIPGLQEAIANGSEAEATAAPVSETDSPSSASPEEMPGSLLAHSESSTWLDRFAQDPAGNTLSVIVLLGMFGSVGWAITLLGKSSDVSLRGSGGWIIPILCLIGFGVAGYLAYVETAQVEAVCGPVGDCNTVQQSEYARLFGILPIGVLGLLGYVSIFTAWLFARYASDNLSNLGSLSIFVMTAFGTAFSIYLTFLEPFVIGATCAWCLTSAVLMTILMLMSVTPAKVAIGKLMSRP